MFLVPWIFYAYEGLGFRSDFRMQLHISSCQRTQKVLAIANRNSSPTYSLALFAPSHSLRMGDFFRKDVKKIFDRFITKQLETTKSQVYVINGGEIVYDDFAPLLSLIPE